MVNSKFQLVLPDELKEGMEVHELLVQPDSDDTGILIMIHDLSADATGYVVRVYQLSGENHEFVVDVELEAFAFPDHEAAVSFANQLPTMTALEMLMILNGNGIGGSSHILQ